MAPVALGERARVVGELFLTLSLMDMTASKNRKRKYGVLQYETSTQSCFKLWNTCRLMHKPFSPKPGARLIRWSRRRSRVQWWCFPDTCSSSSGTLPGLGAVPRRSWKLPRWSPGTLIRPQKDNIHLKLTELTGPAPVAVISINEFGVKAPNCLLFSYF